MTRFALDPGALLELVRAGRVPAPEHQLVAPHAIRTHALELLLRAVREGGIGEREALALHDRMTAVRMRSLGDRVSRRVAWDLAREHGWPDLRDAEYLAVARLQADALIAADSQLAHRASGIVALASAADLIA
jgi:predicted nucleic acid-binding protein